MKLLNEILGTRYPIIQGGMANIATGEFAAACSNAGALGIIGAGGMNADTLRQNIRRCKELTDKPFGVNIMLMHPQADEFAKIVVEEGVPVVTTGAGNPGKYVPMWKAAGIKVIPVVAAAVLAKHFGCGLTVCDVGVNADIYESTVLNRKIAYGTQNICTGPAMTREQTLQAILTGAEIARTVDADVIGGGEMGIGNTTTSSAVLAVLLGADVEAVTGRGGGITEESFRKKKAVIRTAIEVNRPDRDDVVGVLSKVGGFDLAAMCGAFLGAAAARRPAVIDGLISTAAALCAVRLCPNVRGYLVPSHASFEIGYRLAMEAMDLRPLFDLGMRLGEGSGCPLAFQVLDAACAVINDMATFDEAGINDDYLDEIRRGDQFTP